MPRETLDYRAPVAQDPQDPQGSKSIVHAVLSAGCLVASAVFAANAHVVGCATLKGWRYPTWSSEMMAYFRASAVLLAPAVLLFLVSCILARRALSAK